ncbi:hypothetical protein ACLB1O_21625 [Escherichia coli]
MMGKPDKALAPHPATCQMPDATLARLIRPTNSRTLRRPDKAFTPHPASGADCLMRRSRVLSGLRNSRTLRRPDKAFTPHPATQLPTA